MQDPFASADKLTYYLSCATRNSSLEYAAWASVLALAMRKAGAEKEMIQFRESARSAREHYELTEEKYKVGKAGITDYNDARNNYLRAESEHIQARFQCLYQTKLLDFYRGRELEF